MTGTHTPGEQDEAGRPAAGRSWAPLAHRSFRRLAAGRLLVYFANAMAPVALAFAVLDTTGRAHWRTWRCCWPAG
jgi:hypothetical protein